MKIALITPIDLLDLATLSDYHLVLPHLMEDERYRRFYTDAVGYKILDNGAAEGVDVDQHQLHDLGHQLRADELVVPDALEDGNRTIELAQGFERFARPEQFRYVGVAQGRSVAEVVKCINYFSHCEWIRVLALPRSLNKIHKTQRFTLIEPVMKEYGDHFDAVHCLGASSWIREVVAIDSTHVVRGMDTSLPVVLGLEGLSVRDDTYRPRQADYFERTVERDTYTWKVIFDNVTTYLDWGGHNLIQPTSTDFSNGEGR